MYEKLCDCFVVFMFNNILIRFVVFQYAFPVFGVNESD